MTYIEILIDTSGSMGAMKGTKSENQYLLPDGKTRMSLVKKILSEQVLPTLSYATQITVRTFTTSNTPEQTPVIQKIYEGGYHLNLITHKIEGLSNAPLGGTPITAAITEAVNSLKDLQNSDRKIILLTDGEENGGGDYKETIDKAFSTYGVFCKLFVIGICQEKEAQEKAAYLSNKTKGVYKNIDPKSISDDYYIYVTLAPLKDSILRDSIKNIHATTVSLSNSAGVTQQEKVKSPEVIQAINEKVETIKHETKQAQSIIQLEELESKIKAQIDNGQNLLVELASLKEIFRLNLLLESDIDATTLTIDREYSESIRQKSEAFLYEYLCETHGASKVKWLNQNGESMRPYDFELLNDEGKITQIVQCKGTPKDKPTFYLTANEWHHFLINKEQYQLFRVYNLDENPKVVCIKNLFDAILEGQIVPYLLKPEILKEGRVFLTLMKSS